MLEFRNKDDLKRRVNSLLITKKEEFNKRGIDVSEDDIWEYLSKNVFPTKKNLTLIDVVNIIINLEDIN